MTDIYPESAGEGAGQQQGSGDGLKDQAHAAKEKVVEAGQTVRQEAAHFAEASREKAREKVESGKESVTSALGVFADAIRKAGDELGEQDQTMASRLVSQAAEGLEGLSRSIADKSPEDMLHAVRDFGRANPAAFMAGAVLAGVALGRFTRSSAHHSHGSASSGQTFDETGDAARFSGAAGRPQLYDGIESALPQADAAGVDPAVTAAGLDDEESQDTRAPCGAARGLEL